MINIDSILEQQIIRHEHERIEPDTDLVVVEMPIALIYNGISHAVMMATPCDIKEYAIGFTLSEGIVEIASEIYDIDIISHESSIEVELTISQKSFFALKAKRRSMLGKSGCGVCGIESIELLNLSPTPITNSQKKLLLSTTVIEKASKELLQHQFLMAKTGGAHAAAWCNLNGEIFKVFEDVGRHNALDKLIGYLALHKIDVSCGFVFMSSRGSYELVRKIVQMNIPLLATISAPTSLAIETAKKAHVSLICFCRNNRFVEY